MMSASAVRRPWVGEEGEDFIIVLFEIQLYSDSKRKGMGMTVTNKIPPLNIVM